MTLVERLANVKLAIGAVGKDSTMSGSGFTYSYRGIDAILNEAHNALIDEQVIIAPNVEDATYEMRSTSGGKASQWVSMRVRFDVHGPDGDSLTVTTIGEALDTSDKASNKAHTAAFKVCLSQLFAIPSAGDDGDSERHELDRSPDKSRPKDQVHPAAIDLQTRLDDLPEAGRAKALMVANEVVELDFEVRAVADACKNAQWVAWWDGLLTKAEAATAEPAESYSPEQEEPF